MKYTVGEYIEKLETQFKDTAMANWVYWNRISKNEIIHTPDGHIIENIR